VEISSRLAIDRLSTSPYLVLFWPRTSAVVGYGITLERAVGRFVEDHLAIVVRLWCFQARHSIDPTKST
jgi:hypothetical protein